MQEPSTYRTKGPGSSTFTGPRSPMLAGEDLAAHMQASDRGTLTSSGIDTAGLTDIVELVYQRLQSERPPYVEGAQTDLPAYAPTLHSRPLRN
jgi:hypothetical protein